MLLNISIQFPIILLGIFYYLWILAYHMILKYIFKYIIIYINIIIWILLESLVSIYNNTAKNI